MNKDGLPLGAVEPDGLSEGTVDGAFEDGDSEGLGLG
jgi:hypothetical protein